LAALSAGQGFVVGAGFDAVEQLALLEADMSLEQAPERMGGRLGVMDSNVEIRAA